MWREVLHEMSEAAGLFDKMAQRPDWQDKPIGEGIMFPDTKIAAETGKVMTIRASPETDPNIGSISELVGLSLLTSKKTWKTC